MKNNAQETQRSWERNIIKRIWGIENEYIRTNEEVHSGPAIGMAVRASD